MKKKPAELLFELSDEGTAYRLRVRSIAAPLVWVGLSGLTLLLNVFFAENPMHRVIVALMSFLKYIPMLMVAVGAARMKAAKYLADIYELESEDMADNFLAQVAFGEGSRSPRLVIEDGRITEEDERSQLILIGGPGRIQVNLDSAALLEKADGSPHVIYPRKEAWKIGGFERLREIGESDELGEREYAIIHLREQRIKDIRVMARTKDGIPVEARDVKIKFRALRNEKEDLCCDEHAVRALTYRQMTISPESRIITSAGFPWDATIIPLVISEIEKAISSHTADEIAVGIGQKEMDANEDIEKTAQRARVEATGKYEAPAAVKNAAAVAVASREKIHSLFYQREFKEKAAAMGAHLTWIDLGTWQPVGEVRRKIRETWEKARENIKNHANVRALRKKEETNETLNLMDSLINSMHERVGGRGGAVSKDKSAALRELEELAAKNPNLAINPSRWESYASKGSKESPAAVARDMLKAFRKELLAGRAILKEREAALPEEEKRAEISKIEAVLNHINQYFPVTHS